MPTDVDTRPLGEVWQDHESELHAFATRRLGDADAAEEVVAETFASACAIEPPGHWRGWLFTVLRRRIVDRLRRSTVSDRVEEDVARLLSESSGVFRDGFYVARPAAWTGHPAESAQAAEFWRDFDAAVDRLPLKMRQAFVLRELDNEPTEAVCMAIGVSAGNLWTLIHRARLKLREELASHFTS